MGLFRVYGTLQIVWGSLGTFVILNRLSVVECTVANVVGQLALHTDCIRHLPCAVTDTIPSVSLIGK